MNATPPEQGFQFRQVPVARELLATVIDDSPRIAAYGALAITAAELVAKCDRAGWRLRQARQRGALDDADTWEGLRDLLEGATLTRVLNVDAARQVVQADVLGAVEAIDERLDSARASIAAARRVRDGASDDEADRLWTLLDEVADEIRRVTDASRDLFDVTVRRLGDFADQARHSLDSIASTGSHAGGTENPAGDARTHETGQPDAGSASNASPPAESFAPPARPPPGRGGVFLKG